MALILEMVWRKCFRSEMQVSGFNGGLLRCVRADETKWLTLEIVLRGPRI